MPNSLLSVNLSSTPMIATLPTSIIAASSHLDISLSQSPPIPSTSDFIGTHLSSNSNRVTSVAISTDPPSAALPQISAQIHPSPIKPPCHLYMQGSCKPGTRGSNRLLPHPPMVFKCIEKGAKGCDKGSLCTYDYPKLCQSSTPPVDAIDNMSYIPCIRFPQTQPSWHST